MTEEQIRQIVREEVRRIIKEEMANVRASERKAIREFLEGRKKADVVPLKGRVNQ